MFKSKSEENKLDAQVDNSGFNYAAPESKAHSAKIEVEQSWLGRAIKEPKLETSIIFSSLIINLCALATPLIMLQIYDRIIPYQGKATLVLLLAGGMACLILDFALKSLRSYSLGYSASKYMHYMSVEAMHRMMKAPHGSSEGTALSTHIARFNALTSVADFHGGQSRTTAIDLPFVVIFLGIMALVGGSIVLVPIALFALFGFISMSYNKVMNAELNKRMSLDNRKYDFIIEALNGIFTVKALALESSIQRRYERLQENSAEGTYKMVQTGNTIQDISLIFGSVAQICVVAYGAVMTINGQMSMGALACCTLLSGQVLQPLLRSVVVWTDYQNLSLRRDDASKLFATPHIKNTNASHDIKGNITLQNVSVYKDNMLTDITATFNQGEIIGIHSTHDLATTTLLEMMKGDAQPDTGTVLLDGHDLHDAQNASLAQNIVYVAEKSRLFRGTILENLTLFDMNRRRHAAFEAAQLMGLEEEISMLPDGYDTKVGEGASFEFGADFLNRLCIARGLVALPNVLILDHIADNFDVIGVNKLCRVLDALRGRTTVIITSNNNALLRSSDKIFALRNGQMHQARMKDVAPPQRIQQEQMRKAS